MSTKPAWAVTVTISYRNGITQQAVVSNDGIVTQREIVAILERARQLALAMKTEPPDEEAAPGWKPKIVNE
jgi:hypothetical protein